MTTLARYLDSIASCSAIALDPVRDRFMTLYLSWKSLGTLCLRSALPRMPQHHVSTGIVQGPPHGTGQEPCRLLDISCCDGIVSAPSGLCYSLASSPHRSCSCILVPCCDPMAGTILVSCCDPMAGIILVPCCDPMAGIIRFAILSQDQ